MAMLTVAGGDLYYETHGDGPVVVLAHGVGGNHAIWFRQIAVLARTYKVVVFDHRGFGLSRDLDGSGRAAFVEDLRALLGHLGVEKAALVGQSMGAGTCIGFAGTYPSRVGALIVAASLHGIAEEGAVKTRMDAARAASDGLDQLERVLGARFRAANEADSLLYRAIASFNSTTRKTLTGAWPLLQTPAVLGARNIPILFLAGTDDVVFPIEAVRLVQEQVPGSFLVELDAGHSAFFEQPVEFNDSLLSFLAMAGFRPKGRAAHSNAAGYVVPAT
jgi:3-oxoadipate enol-lactonase